MKSARIAVVFIGGLGIGAALFIHKPNPPPSAESGTSARLEIVPAQIPSAPALATKVAHRTDSTHADTAVVPPPPSEIPDAARRISELSNIGTASAMHASQTFIWAATHNKPDILAEMIVWRFFGDRSTAISAFAKLPEPQRQEFQSPERLMAIMHRNESQRFSAVEVIGHRVFGPNDEEILLRWYAADGSAKDESMLMLKVGDTWKREQQPHLLRRLVEHLRTEYPQRK